MEIKTEIKKNNDKSVLEITQDLIKFKSTTGNFLEIRKCLDYIKNYLKDTKAYIEEIDNNGVVSLFITYHKTKKPTILLNGHIDVVPAEDNQYNPYIKDGKIFGRGAVDMKGGVAACLKVFYDLKDIKPDIGLMIVSDEEIGGFNGSKYLLDEGYSGEFIIASEPTSFRGDNNLDIVVKEKGVLQLEIIVGGKSAHASRPWEGSNSFENLYDVYFKIKDYINCVNDKSSWNNTINLGIIEGGKTPNQIPSESKMKIDIRYTEKLNKDDLLDEIKKINYVNEVNVIADAPLLINDDDNYFINKLKLSGEKYSLDNCNLIYEHAASDLRFFSDKKIPCSLIGPYGENYHGLGEFVSIESLNILYNTLIDFIKNTQDINKN